MKEFNTFFVDVAIYKASVRFVISKDFDRSKKYINAYFENNMFVEIDSFAGKTMYCFGYAPITWLPELNYSPACIGVLSHEISHVADLLLETRGLPKDGEARAYLVEYLTFEVLTKWRKINEKRNRKTSSRSSKRGRK